MSGNAAREMATATPAFGIDATVYQIPSRTKHAVKKASVEPIDASLARVGETGPRPAGREANVAELPTSSTNVAVQLSLQPLQEWEGYVTEISADTFTARLVDVTASGDTETEVADFPVSDLVEDDIPLLKEGAVFRWVVGYQRRPSGQKIRASQIVFRRLPAWSKNDLRVAAAKATQLLNEISWD